MSCPPKCLAALIAVALLASDDAGAQTAATARSALLPHNSSSVLELRCASLPSLRDANGAFDLARGRLVVPGTWSDNAGPQAETWEWDGRRWVVTSSQRTAADAADHVCTYASFLGAVVSFNGNQLRKWTGSEWEPLPGASPPPPRTGATLACDTKRARLVLFGGDRRSDTWEWDGSRWHAQTPASSPPGNTSVSVLARSVYDIRRGVVVLQTPGDTSPWEWDGTNWTRVATAQLPARGSSALVYDILRGVTVLYGGFDGARYFADTWEYDGSAWRQRTPALSPAARVPAFYGFDLARGVALIGCGDGSALPMWGGRDLWAWNGTEWRELQPGDSPGTISEALAAYDATLDECVLYGGFDGGKRNLDTMVLRGGTWRRFRTTTDPGAASAMAYDGTRRRVVLLTGGRYGPQATWEWNGTDWIAAQVTGQPIGAYGASLTYDERRGALVFYSYAALPVNELWELQGNRWSRQTPVITPPSSGFHAAAYDPVRGEVLICTGGVSGGVSDLMWSWNGSRWSRLDPPVRPSPRSDATMFQDPRRGRLLLFGGFDPSNRYLQELWEWDGSEWRIVPSAGQRTPRGRGRAEVFDSKRSVLWSIGGYGLGGRMSSEVWELRLMSGSIGRSAAGSPELTMREPALLGGVLHLGFPNERRTALLGLAPAGLATPIHVRGPGVCSEFAWHPDPGQAHWIPMTADPGILQLAIPDTPAFVDLPVYAQSLVLRGSGCIAGTNALLVIVRMP